MKILILYQYFGTPKGSWSTRIYEQARRWVSKGHDVTVITAPYLKSDIRAEKFIERQEVDGIKLIVINSSDSNKDSTTKRIYNSLRFALVASYYAIKEKGDVLLASSGPITIGIPAILGKKLSGKKMVFEVRDLWPAGAIEMKKITSPWQIRMGLAFEKMCYKNASLIAAASPGQRDHIVARFKDREVLVIPNASDTELFGKRESALNLPAWAAAGIIFTHIGSLGFIHNCGLIVRSAEKLREKGRTDIQIVFIGDGAEKEQLETYAKEKKLDAVHFLGLKPKVELPAWVQASRATLFTTLDNPIQNTSSPNKIFDSFAAGVPVIQTTTGWIKDLIDNSHCGINVPPEDADALANAMIRLADNKEEAAILGENARGIASREFNRDVLAEKYISAIENVLNG